MSRLMRITRLGILAASKHSALPMLWRYDMGGGSNHIGKIVTIAVTVQNAEGRQCTQITSGIKKASTLYAHTAARRWIYRRNIMTKRESIIEILEQMEAAMERLGGTRAEIWRNDIIYCLCRA